MAHKTNQLLKEGLILPRYEIKLIYLDKISKIFSFFKKNIEQSKISKFKLNEKKDQLKNILKYAWDTHEWDRTKATANYLQFFNEHRFQFNGLESGYLLRMRQGPRDDYLIINKDAEITLINEEQMGIISTIICPKEGFLEIKCNSCQDRENICEKWIFSEEGGIKFRKVFQESHVPSLSQELYNVFKNSGKKIYNAFHLNKYYSKN